MPSNTTRPVLLTAVHVWLAAGAAAAARAGTAPFLDSLAYDDGPAMQQVWRARDPGDPLDRLMRRPDGVTFSDISGDCWRDLNTQGAVALKRPHFAPPYAVEVSVSGFRPKDVHAQVGLVAWRDADNYVRCTTGFTTPRCEFIAETDGATRVVAWPVEPRRPRPDHIRFRIEVRQQSLRTYAALRAGYWIELGTHILPPGMRAGNAFPRIGLLGVGGAMAAAPRFHDWREERLAPFAEDTFDGAELAPPWRLGQTARGWGDDMVTAQLTDGGFTLTPFAGSDITSEKVRHVPYVAQRPPPGNTWELELRIRSFPADTPGRWWRAGLLLWQDRQHLVHVSVISDDGLNHMNLEAIAVGALGANPNAVLTGGFGPRRTTPVWLRMARVGSNRYRFRGSFDGDNWVDLGTIDIALTDPELRLYACGDQTLREMNRVSFPVAFEEIRLLSPTGPGNGGAP